MIVLIPFKLLALRKLISKERSPENLQALQDLIRNDILTSIKTNVEVGNISRNDGVKLQDNAIAKKDEEILLLKRKLAELQLKGE